MNPVILQDIIKHGITVFGPCITAAIGIWKYFDTQKAKIESKVLDARHVLEIMEKINVVRLDIEALKHSDKDRVAEIHVLEQDQKELYELIIDVLKNK